MPRPNLRAWPLSDPSISPWGLPTQCCYWMASLKPLPARNPGVFDAAI